MTLLFIVKKWLGVRDSIGAVLPSTDKGRPFTMASASHINVRRASSFSWLPQLDNSDDITFLTDRI